jgi:chromosome segregation ATPase
MGVDKGDGLDIDDETSSSSSSEANQDHNGERLIHTELNLQNNRGDDDEDDLQQFGQTNPLMQRVQEALRSQLQRTKERVRDELLQHEEELRKVRSEREEMGLKLFGLQQQLANVQSNFHKANETYQTLLNSRDENDGLIVQYKMALETYAKEVKDLAAHNVVAQTELHRTHTAAAQAKDHNEAIKGDISVARRIAQKTEQDTKELEKGKNAQDLYILSLTERIRPLEEEINVTTRQIETQKGQTFDLRQMIKETSAEFDALGMDTKQILQQWKTSVVALQLRDEGLMAARAALKTIQDETKEIARELSQSQREVVVLTQRKADLIAAGTRQDNESKYLDGLINAIQAEQDIMAQKYESNSKSIVASNDDENRLAMELKKVRGEIATIEQKIKLVDSDRVRLEQL